MTSRMCTERSRTARSSLDVTPQLSACAEQGRADLRTICAQNVGNGRERPVTTVNPLTWAPRPISMQDTTKAQCWTGVALMSGPPGSRSRHLGIKSPLLFPMS